MANKKTTKKPVARKVVTRKPATKQSSVTETTLSMTTVALLVIFFIVFVFSLKFIKDSKESVVPVQTRISPTEKTAVSPTLNKLPSKVPSKLK